MIWSAGLWVRRGSARFILPVLLGFLIFGLFRDTAWRHEWLWGLRAISQTMPLVGTIIAAGAAYDTTTGTYPILSGIGAQAARGWRFVVPVILAHVVTACLAFLTTALLAAVVLARSDALGSPDLWFPLEIVAATAGCAGVGVVCGIFLSQRTAPVVAGIVTFGLTMMAPLYSMNGLLSAASAVSSALGLVRSPSVAATAIGLNAMIVVSALIIVAVTQPPATRSRVWVWGVVLVVLSGAVVHRAASRSSAEYVPAPATTICAGDNVQVCGPDIADRYLHDVARELDRAERKLRPSGLPFATAYDLILPGQEPAQTSDAVPVFLPPDTFYHDPSEAAVSVLAQPRLCPELVTGGPNTTKILDATARVQSWLEEEMAGDSVTPAPPSVVHDFTTVTSCAEQE